MHQSSIHPARAPGTTHTAALRAARKAAEFFALPAYARDFVATHLKVAKLLALESSCGKPWEKAVRAAAEHLAARERECAGPLRRGRVAEKEGAHHL